MKLLCITILVGIAISSRASPIHDSESVQENLVDVSEAKLNREKRNFPGIFSFVIGETILDIQCKRGYLTVCAPDGPDACPVGYSYSYNVGECGFATLNHYLNTSNIAGTCCYKLASAATVTTTAAPSATTSANYIIPQIVAYPVYAQYPYAIQNSQSSVSSGSASAYGSPSSSNYG